MFLSDAGKSIGKEKDYLQQSRKKKMKENQCKELKTGWAGKPCLSFAVLPSTNDYGKALVKEGKVHGTLITAEEQTAGKGRRGRSWQSPKGTAIYMSLCLEPEFPADRAAGLTLVMAMAAAEAIEKMTGAEVQIKWPNDLVVNRKKVCGILTELCIEPDHYAVIIGTGINVNTEVFPEEIKETATSLKLETGIAVSRTELTEKVMRSFEILYEKYMQTWDLSLLKEQYELWLANKGREVRVLDPKGAYTGIAKGIASDGSLMVQCEDGSEQKVSSGEVSVRGLYGYV